MVHVVQKGDCLASISKYYGFKDWKPIHDAPENQSLWESRKDPHILYPGDEVTIPEPRVKEESGATDASHKFKVKRKKVWFRVVARGRMGKPMVGKKYKLFVGAEELEGTTGGDGLIEREIQADATQVQVKVWPYPDHQDVTWDMHVDLGYLDPDEEISGLKGRLNNLGFQCGEADDVMDEETAEAIRAFQDHHKLERTGEFDGPTKQKLLQKHDKI
jgi:hypothetical protein